MQLNRLKIGLWSCFIFFSITSLSYGQSSGQADDKNLVVSKTKEVSIEYILKLEDGTVVEHNEGKKPLSYIHGNGKILPGLEKNIEGMQCEETKEFTTSPEESYGLIKKERMQEVPKESMPKEALNVGTIVQGKNQSGQIVRGRVAEIKEKTVVLDFNHPLAGKKLFWKVKILTIQ